jgi:hypothetical protein
VWSASVYRLEFSPNRLILWASDARKEAPTGLVNAPGSVNPHFHPGVGSSTCRTARSSDGGVA